jgi:hypothetical protein
VTKLPDAEDGAETLAAVTGHKNVAIVKHYTKSRDQRKLTMVATPPTGVSPSTDFNST